MKKQNGLSLIEAVISAFIATLSILSMTGLKLSQAHATQSQQQFYHAWQLIEYKLTDLRRLTNDADQFSALVDDSGGMMASGDIQQAQFIYQLNWQVSDMTVSSAALSLKKITVTVTWRNRHDEKLMISDSTLLVVLIDKNNQRNAL